MNHVIAYFHSYIFALLQPSKVHDWLKHGIAPWADLELPPRPGLAESIGVSWVMAIVQALGKIALASLILQYLIDFQIESGWAFNFIDTDAELVPYYFLVISTSLDLIFFPIVTLVVTQFWNFVVRTFGWLLGLEKEERELAADQITVVALSSNFFLVLPVLGVVLQKFAWLFLMYKGLRRNLGASRSLSVIVLVAPSMLMLMLASLLVLAVVFALSTHR